MNEGLKLFLAALPILMVLVGLGVLKKPAFIVAPVTAVVTILLGIYTFHSDWGTMIQTYVYQKGAIEGLKTACMLWGAFSLLKFMQSPPETLILLHCKRICRTVCLSLIAK